MDSFHEPNKARASTTAALSLDTVREQVIRLEADHKAKGIELSGRILHLCHYLPVTLALKPSLADTSGIPSPPATPPAKNSDIPESPTDTSAPALATPKAEVKSSEGKWKIGGRYGHSAMISGITSLAQTHEQLIIGWTGDVASNTPVELPPVSSRTDNPVRPIQHQRAPSISAVQPPDDDEETAGPKKVPLSAISDEEKKSLEDTLQDYTAKVGIRGEGDKPTSYVPVWIEEKVAHGHYDGYCKQSEYLSIIPLSCFIRSIQYHLRPFVCHFKFCYPHTTRYLGKFVA